MRSLQDEIRQAHRDLFCPICSRTFELKDIQLQTFTSNAKAELSVICSRGHFPVILIVPVSLKEASKVGLITKSELRSTYRKLDALSDSLAELVGKK